MILEMSEAFCQRDKKPETRNEYEAGARNSFWQEAARKFNDREFAPTLVPSRDPEMNEHYARGRFSPAWTPYVADAEKLAAVFRDDLCPTRPPSSHRCKNYEDACMH